MPKPCAHPDMLELPRKSQQKRREWFLECGTLNQTDTEKRGWKVRNVRRKASKRDEFLQVTLPPKPETVTSTVPVLSRKTKFYVPLQIWTQDPVYDPTVQELGVHLKCS